MHLFDFSLCSLATLSLKFFSRELSWSWCCSIAIRWKGLSPVAVSLKLRKFKCKIAAKKKMKVKLISKINMKYNIILFRNLNSLGIIKIGVNNDQLETWGQQWSKYNWSTDDKNYWIFGRTFVSLKSGILVFSQKLMFSYLIRD